MYTYPYVYTHISVYIYIHADTTRQTNTCIHANIYILLCIFISLFFDYMPSQPPSKTPGTPSIEYPAGAKEAERCRAVVFRGDVLGPRQCGRHYLAGNTGALGGGRRARVRRGLYIHNLYIHICIHVCVYIYMYVYFSI